MKELKVDLIPAIKKLSVYTKKTTTSAISGGYRSIFRGRGLEFDHYREYTAMDDAKFIDWRATLKAQVPLVKVFSEERNIDVFFMLDISNSMLFGSTDKLKCEYAIELVSSLTYAIIQAEDNVGLGMFNKKVVKYSPPSAGNKQYYTVKKLLTDPEVYGGGYDLNEAMKFSSGYLKRGGVIIVVSDFIGLGKDWDKFLKIGSRKFDIIGMMIRDPRDYELPRGVGEVVIQDPYSDEKIIIDTKKEGKKYAEYNKKNVEKVKNSFNDMGADFVEINTRRPFAEQVIGFFEAREKRWR